MRNRRLVDEEARIKLLMSKASVFTNANDFEGMAEWSKYICIVVAGYMEHVIREVYADYARAQVSGPVANFVVTVLSGINNPKPQRFLETAARFNDSWRADLEQFFETDGVGEAVESIMNNRHQIAHGDSRTSSLSMARVNDYYQKCLSVTKFIEKQCAT